MREFEEKNEDTLYLRTGAQSRETDFSLSQSLTVIYRMV